MSEYIYATNGELVANIDGEISLAREEVVRCFDCKHHELQNVSYSDKPLSVCTAEWCEGSEHDNPLVESNGFCAWGERREP